MAVERYSEGPGFDLRYSCITFLTLLHTKNVISNKGTIFFFLFFFSFRVDPFQKGLGVQESK